MQLAFGSRFFLVFRRRHFQYPQSDRRRCNDGQQHNNDHSRPAFSILNRIGGDATLLPRGARLSNPNFQYPQSDRRRCNSIEATAGSIPASFQYPQSDRRRCNRLMDAFFVPAAELSVSSIGSEAMQPCLRLAHRSGYFGFQYPQSDRRRCNRS